MSVKRKLPKQISKSIKDIYYPAKPAINFRDHNQIFNDAKRSNFQGQFDDFPVEPIDSTIKTREQARKVFDKVYYPLKVIVPPKLRKAIGIQEMVFKTYKGKRNCIRYYTKSKFLTRKQCALLYLDEDIRSVYGFTINDKPMTDSNLLRYLQMVGELERKADKLSSKSQQEYSAYREMSPPFKTNPDGSRKPMVIQMGVNSYMERNKINNPVKIIDTHVTKEQLKIYDFANLGAILSELNITAQEGLDYICKYLNKNRNIKRKHTEDRELSRGATALKNLIDFYKAEVKRTTALKLDKPKTKIFGYKELMNSPQYETYCQQSNEPQLRGYESFCKWIKKRLNTINKLK